MVPAPLRDQVEQMMDEVEEHRAGLDNRGFLTAYHNMYDYQLDVQTYDAGMSLAPYLAPISEFFRSKPVRQHMAQRFCAWTEPTLSAVENLTKFTRHFHSGAYYTNVKYV